DEIGKAVELSAKAGRSLQEARQTAVDPVENSRKDNGREREHIAVLEGHPDRSQSGAHCEERDHIRRERAHRNAAEAPAAWVTRTGRCYCHGDNIAACAGACHRAFALRCVGLTERPRTQHRPETASPPAPT